MNILPKRRLLMRAVALLCLAAPVAMGAGDEKAPSVVARVGPLVISQREYEQALSRVAAERARRASMAGQPAPGFMTDEERRQVLDGMIDARVVSILAKDAVDEAPASLVSGKIESFKSRFPSQEAFEKSLVEQGMTLDDLAESIRDRLRVEKFIFQRTNHVTATEEEVAAAYERHKNQGLLDTVDVAHILIKVPSNDEAVWEEAKQRIDAARVRIVNGEDFAEVAKEVSEDPGSAKNGGLFPNTARGRMTPEFDRIAFSIPIGELSEPFRTEYGWHILKTSGRGTVPLKDAAPRITQEVTREKRRNELKRVVEEAKGNMIIEINLPPATSDGDAPEETDGYIPLPDEAS
jgi:parvulin-like peptidyl-prolyl isomerase